MEPRSVGEGGKVEMRALSWFRCDACGCYTTCPVPGTFMYVPGYSLLVKWREMLPEAWTIC